VCSTQETACVYIRFLPRACENEGKPSCKSAQAVTDCGKLSGSPSSDGLAPDEAAPQAATDCARRSGSGRGGQQTVQGVQEESEWEILEMAASSPAPQRVIASDALANVSRNKYIPSPLSLSFFLFFWISRSQTDRQTDRKTDRTS
jgi:hypothetical protein